MNLWQAFKMAFKSISMKKTRSFLTMLGIIIGVASVVIMVSVVQGQNRQTMEMFEKLGDNKITVQAYGYYDTNNETSQKLYDYCLTMSDLVEGITPDVEINETATVQYGAKTIRINDWNNGNYDWQTAMHIKLGSDQYGVCNNYTLAGGREMSYLDVEKTNAVCVLGAGAKEALFDFTDPVGEYITINGQPFKVVGYYEAVDLEGWNELDNIIVLPYTFNRSMNNNYNIDSYVVKAKSAQANHSQAHNGAASKADEERRLNAPLGSLCGAGIGQCGHQNADFPGNGRKYSTRQVSKRHKYILQNTFRSPDRGWQKNKKNGGNDNCKYRQNPVLTIHKGFCALLDKAGNLNDLLVRRWLTLDPKIQVGGKSKSQCNRKEGKRIEWD